MSTSSQTLVHEHHGDDVGVLAWMCWLISLILAAAAALLGGMAFLILSLAVALSAIVWTRPQEAAGAGLLFLFASNVLLPLSSRFDGYTQPWEMYYWAVGLFMITAVAVSRIGLRRVFDVPLSAKFLLGVAVMAAVYAEVHGAATSYVLRQFYGLLLLVVYIGIALNAGSEELLLRRIKAFGVLCALCFFVYYIAVFGKYGFHKETGFSGAQAALMAIILFLAGLERKKPLWILGTFILLLVPTLLFMRSDILTFVFAITVAFALKLRSKPLRILCWSASVLIALPALYPPIAQAVIDEIASIQVVGDMIPVGIQSSDTLTDRAIQLAETFNTVKAHPLLGVGLGSEFEWDSPSEGLLEGAYVDSGWGYLIQKMGIIGAIAFIWFLITVFSGISRQSAALSAALLSATFIMLFSQPVFFHFATAPFVGTFAGLLLRNKSIGHGAFIKT